LIDIAVVTSQVLEGSASLLLATFSVCKKEIKINKTNRKTNKQNSARKQIKEFRAVLEQYKRQSSSRRALSWREIVLNWAEAAQVLGVSHMSMWRYRRDLPAFTLPTFKSVVRRLAETYGLPRKRNPRHRAS
jgi:hypothetical protein